jgi:hypothetical protein
MDDKIRRKFKRFLFSRPILNLILCKNFNADSSTAVNRGRIGQRKILAPLPGIGTQGRPTGAFGIAAGIMRVRQIVVAALAQTRSNPRLCIS